MKTVGIRLMVGLAAACLCGWGLAGVYGLHAARAQGKEPLEAKEAAPAGGKAVGGLQMSIQPEKTSYAVGEKMKFRIEMRNVAGQDLILNLGIMLGNGRKQYANAVCLILTDASGKKTKLRLMGPAAVAGRVDDFLVPLPAGAAYVLETALGDYCCLDTKEFRIEPAPGQYPIAAAYEGTAPHYINSDTEGLRLLPVLTGEIASETSSFTVVAK